MATSAPQFPAKEQAIVMNAVDDLKLTDYVVAIGNIVQPKNIIFASRISNGRICIYMSSKLLVDQVVADHPVITIKDFEVNIRRLMNPARRIIFSNVCPSVPHNVIENLVQTLGFTAVSKMSFLRASIEGDEFKHVLSFRRQIYIQPDDSINLPSSMVIKYDNTNYRIFLSYDDVCFKCKVSGHFASDCPNQTEPTDQTDTSNSSTPLDLAVGKSRALDDQLETSNLVTPSPSTTAKRSAPDEPSIEFIPPDQPQLNLDDTDQSVGGKKIKPSDSTESLTPTSEILAPAEQLINNAHYPLTFEETVAFLEKAVGKPDILSLIREYTNDIYGVLIMLHDIYPLVSHKNLKNRCKKIQKRIKKALSSLPEEHGTDLSGLFQTPMTSAL